MSETVQTHFSMCFGRREIEKMELCIKPVETSKYTISNMTFSLHFCQKLFIFLSVILYSTGGAALLTINECPQHRQVGIKIDSDRKVWKNRCLSFQSFLWGVEPPIHSIKHTYWLNKTSLVNSTNLPPYLSKFGFLLTKNKYFDVAMLDLFLWIFKLEG